MNEITKEVQAGQAVYSKGVLALYDWWVLGVSNQFIWKCPTSKLIDLYNKNVSSNHLDVGVGTGYLLDHCHFPTKNPEISLMDLNMNSLQACANRLQRYQPSIYQKNVFEPTTLDGEKFDSIGINYLLHCLPGNIKSKSIIFKNLGSLLNDEGTLFGSTLLQQGVTRNKAAQYLMKLYNKKGIFSNRTDSLKDLEETLKNSFKEVSIQVVGCAALFWAR